MNAAKRVYMDVKRVRLRLLQKLAFTLQNFLHGMYIPIYSSEQGVYIQVCRVERGFEKRTETLRTYKRTQESARYSREHEREREKERSQKINRT